MKICPRCGSRYDDDSLAFCMNDGALLAVLSDQEATLITSPKPLPNFAPLPVQPLTSFPTPATTTQTGNWANYFIITLLALIAGGGLVALIRPYA